MNLWDGRVACETLWDRSDLLFQTSRAILEKRIIVARGILHKKGPPKMKVVKT